MNNRLYNYILTVIVLCVTALQSKAQYPVQVMPQIISPASLVLSDYYTGTSPKLFVNLTNRDLQQPNLQVRLRVRISSNTVVLTTNESRSYTPITLDPGIPKRLFSQDLSEYLNPNNLNFQGITQQQYLSAGKLPEGMYSFCFEVVESATNRVLSQSGQCAMVWLSLTEPPLLNIPANRSKQVQKDPTFLTFSWTPRHLNSANSRNAEYLFEMVELLDNQVDPNMGFSSSRVLYTTKQRATTLVYGPSEPLLIPGKRYAWRVRLVPIDLTQEYDQIKNNGYSDIYSFDYRGDCPASEILTSVAVGNSANLSWSKKKNYGTYQIKYRPANRPNAVPGFVTVNGLSGTASGLYSDTRYAFWISYLCVDGSEVNSEIAYVDIVGDGRIVAPGGGSGGTPTSDIVNSLKAEVTGELKWAAKGKGAADKLDFARKGGTDVVKENLTPYTNTDPTQVLAGADVKLFLVKRGSRTLVASTKTDGLGKYKFSVIKEVGTYEVEYSHVSGAFDVLKKEVTINYDNTAKIFKGSDNAVILAKMMEFKPAIVAVDFTPAEIAKMTIDVLIDPAVWSRTYGTISGQLGVTGTQLVDYNSKKWHVLRTLRNGEDVGKFLQNSGSEAYVARVTIPDVTSVFVPIDAITSSQRLVKNVVVYLNHSISGKANFAGKPKEGVRITVTVKTSDQNTSTSSSQLLLSYRGMTDATGSYHIKIPRLKKGAIINIEAIDYSIASTPFKGTVAFETKTEYKYDFLLKSQSYTYAGRLTTPTGQAIGNALVEVTGARAPVRTTRDGFFIVQGNFNSTSTIKFSADQFYANTFTVGSLTPIKLNPRGSNPSVEWSNGVKALPEVVSFLRANAGKTANAGLFLVSKGTEGLETVYSQLGVTATEEISGIIAPTNLTLKPTHFTAEITVRMGGNLIAANVEILQGGKVLQNLPTVTGGNVLYKGPAGNYNYRITPKTGGPLFINAEGNFNLVERIGANQTFAINVVKATLSRFVVKNKSDNRAIEGATIRVEGITTQGTTDRDGRASVLIPSETVSSYKIFASKTAFNASNRMIRTADLGTGEINYLLEEIIDVPVKKISGFEVTITSQVREPDSANVVKVSGQLTLPDNDVFKTTPSTNKIAFRNVLVKLIDKNGGAIAISDIGFETATLRANVFGGIPVEIDQVHLTKLEGQDNYTTAVIRGSKVKTVFSAATNASAPIRSLLNSIRHNAWLIDSSGFDQEWKIGDRFAPFEIPQPRGVKLNSIVRAFVSPGVRINALREDKIFKLHFDMPQGYVGDVIPISVLGTLNMNIKFKEANMDKDGMKMKGSLQVPSSLSQRADSNGRMTMSVFNIRSNMNSVDVTFDISRTRPFFMQLQKIQAKITHVGVEGLGSTNCGVNLGGEVWLTQKDRNSRDSAGVLTIKTLSFANRTEGVTLSGEFMLPSKGISIKALTFKTTNGSSISFSFNFSQRTFEFQAGGTLSYGVDSSTNAVAKKVFPLEIQTFSLKTKDWSFLLIARPNKQIDFGVVKVNVTAFLVNVGYAVSLDQMGSMLTNPSMTLPPMLGGPDDLVEEARTNWAIGLSGSIEFPIKDLKVEAGATVLLGSINGRLDFRISEILLKIDRDPTFTLEARVQMSFGGDKVGFEAAAKMIVLGNGLAASFKYWQFKTGGFELGASITLSTAAGIITGPVTWLSIGGGFNFNTATNIYEVWLNGEVTNTGNTRATMYVAIDRLSILFATNQCGPKPVIEANGGLYIKMENWLQVKIKADFCKMMFLLDMNGSIPTIPGLTRVQVRGTVFAAAAWDGQPACLFICLNASMNFHFINGNITFALGVNVDKNRRHMPTEVLTQWPNIGARALEQNGQYFNAFYVGAFLSVPQQQGSFRVGVGSFTALGLEYNVYGNASGEFWAMFSRTELGLAVRIDAGARGSVTILGATLNGAATLVSTLNGGYNQVWYLNGTINANMSVWMGHADCNSVNVRWGGCFSVPYPCGFKKWFKIKWCNSSEVCPIPVGIGGAKICFSVNAAFDYRQGRATTVSLSR